MAIHVNKSVFANGLHDLKSHLKGKGFKTKVILDDDTMEAASNIVRADKAYTLTPPDELRYIEGLLNLPFNHIEEFGVIPTAGSHVCACGRKPSALDLIVTTLRQGFHGVDLVRNTIIGFDNIFEMAESGREAMCTSCGKPVVLAVYHYKRPYLYA